MDYYAKPCVNIICAILVLLPLSTAQLVYTISEAVGADYSLGHVLTDSGLAAEYEPSVISVLQYRLMSSGSLPTDYFKINNKTSELQIAKQIDRDNFCDLLSLCCQSDTKCEIPLDVAVQPTRGTFFMRTLKVNVEVLDENDNSPQFQSKEIQGHISEAAGVGSTVSLPTDGNLLIASDRDAGQYGIKNYSIISPTGTFGLRVEEDFGVVFDVEVVTLKQLDREVIGEYKVIIVARDGGTPSKSGSVTVNIIVDDANDNAPVFGNDTYSVWIDEDVSINTNVMTVSATDLDIDRNAKITYSIRTSPNDPASNLFDIDPSTGVMRTIGRLNYEEYPVFHIMVQAADDGQIQKKSRATVTVHLRGVNDHPPSIRHTYMTDSGRAEVSEAAGLGTFVAHLLVSDPDKDIVNCEIDSPMFRLMRSNPNDLNEYHLVTAHKLNREMADEYQVTLTCTDQGKPVLRTAETFTVYVIDANDNAPKFTQSTYTTSITENNRIGVFLVQVQADDADTGENARIIYSLSESGKQNFSIDYVTGRIYAKRSFDREDVDQILLKVTARDNGTEPQSAEASVVIRIVDENDNPPMFHPPLEFEISEAAGIGVMLGQMSATDPDVGPNAQIRFQLQYSRDAQSFDISPNGLITTRLELDRETQSSYSIVVIAKDNGTTVLSSTAKVRIVVTDINDQPPIIHFPNTYNNTVYISYLEPVGATITTVNATDKDDGKNAFLEYLLDQGNENGIFRVNQNTGTIYVAKQMQKQNTVVYKLSIRVKDRADPWNSNVEVLNIVVDGTGKAISITGEYLDSIASNRNLIIVICLAAVSGLLVVVLIVAIVCIKKKDRENHRYSVTNESERIYEKCGSDKNANAENVVSAGVRDGSPVGFVMKTERSLPVRNGTNGLNTTYATLRTQPTWNSSIHPRASETKLYRTRHDDVISRSCMSAAQLECNVSQIDSGHSLIEDRAPGKPEKNINFKPRELRSPTNVSFNIPHEVSDMEAGLQANRIYSTLPSYGLGRDLDNYSAPSAPRPMGSERLSRKRRSEEPLCMYGPDADTDNIYRYTGRLVDSGKANGNYSTNVSANVSPAKTNENCIRDVSRRLTSDSGARSPINIGKQNERNDKLYRDVSV